MARGHGDQREVLKESARVQEDLMESARVQEDLREVFIVDQEDAAVF